MLLVNEGGRIMLTRAIYWRMTLPNGKQSWCRIGNVVINKNNQIIDVEFLDHLDLTHTTKFCSLCKVEKEWILHDECNHPKNDRIIQDWQLRCDCINRIWNTKTVYSD